MTVQPGAARRKHRKLSVSLATLRAVKKAEVLQMRTKALADIRNVLQSERDAVFKAGRNGLQSYRARAVQACLRLVVEKGHKLVEASISAAKGNGFSRNHGAREVRRWTQKWTRERVLPTSMRGDHARVSSFKQVGS